MDVLPDVQLGPVADREDPDALSTVDASVVDVPELRSLVLGIPAVEAIPEAEDALLGPGLLLVTTGAAEGRIEATGVEGLLEGLGLHDVGVVPGPVVEGVDPVSDTIRVGVDDQVEAQLGGGPVPELDHLPELPGGVHVQYRERDLPGEERLAGDVQEYRRVLADGVHHHRALELGDHLAHDVDGLGLQLAQVGEAQLRWQRGGRGTHGVKATAGRPVPRRSGPAGSRSGMAGFI